MYNMLAGELHYTNMLANMFVGGSHVTIACDTILQRLIVSFVLKKVLVVEKQYIVSATYSKHLYLTDQPWIFVP